MSFCWSNLLTRSLQALVWWMVVRREFDDKSPEKRDSSSDILSCVLTKGVQFPCVACKGCILHESSCRELVWIEGQNEGWGCSECAWVFDPPGPPADESKRNSRKSLLPTLAPSTHGSKTQRLGSGAWGNVGTRGEQRSWSPECGNRANSTCRTRKRPRVPSKTVNVADALAQRAERSTWNLCHKGLPSDPKTRWTAC